jgi:hypothetical protein
MKLFRRKGQSVVEFAILFPFFLLIVVGGIVDFGFAFFNLITLQQITNDTAQYAAEHRTGGNLPGTSEIETYAKEKAPKFWSNTVKVTVLPEATVGLGATSRIVKKVLIEYTGPLYTPFWQSALGVVTGGGIPLSAMAAYPVPKIMVNNLR